MVFMSDEEIERLEKEKQEERNIDNESISDLMEDEDFIPEGIEVPDTILQEDEVKIVEPEEKPIYVKARHVNEIKFVMMKRNHKISYRSGWLIQDEVYHVEDLEGGKEAAIKLILSKTAVGLSKASKTSTIVPPEVISPISKERQERMTKDDVRELASSRRGGK